MKSDFGYDSCIKWVYEFWFCQYPELQSHTFLIGTSDLEVQDQTPQVLTPRLGKLGKGNEALEVSWKPHAMGIS